VLADRNPVVAGSGTEPSIKVFHGDDEPSHSSSRSFLPVSTARSCSRQTRSLPRSAAGAGVAGLHVTLLPAPDQFLVSGRLAEPWVRLRGPGTVVPCGNQPGRPGHEITRRKRAALHPLRTVTAACGPSGPHCDTKRTTATIQAPPVRVTIPATKGPK
jgi:hypothetical protein